MSRRERELVRAGVLRGERLLAFVAAQPARDRDRVVEEILGIEEPPPVRPLEGELIGYVPSGVSAIVRAIAEVPVVDSDVLIDIGSGLGKVVMIAHLLSGAQAVGVEVQADLVAIARERAQQLRLDGVSFVAGDARDADLSPGTVFFLYAPFLGSVLAEVMEKLRDVARRRTVVVCALGVDLHRWDWLVERAAPSFWLSVYESRCPGAAPRPKAPSRLAIVDLVEAVADERDLPNAEPLFRSKTA